MSETGELVQNGVSAEDEFVDASEGREKDGLKKVEIQVNEASDEPAVNGATAEDDRTEDQVPDITGTENADPMTTSMDGIEDIPEAQDAPITDAEGNAEIPVEAFEDAAEEQPVATEDAPATEKTEQPAEEEIEQAVEEITAEEAAPEEAAKENGEFELQSPPSPKRPRTPHELDEKEPTPALSVQGSAISSRKGSASEAPGTPHTPKTPSAVSGAGGDETEEGEVPSGGPSNAPSGAPSGAPSNAPSGAPSGAPSEAASQAASQIGSQPGTPIPTSNAGSQPGTPRPVSNAGSQPGTPRPVSNAGSQPQTPRSTRSSRVDETPGTPRVSEPATPRSKLANGSVPGTPKEGSNAATPKTGASNKAFDFDGTSAQRTPKRTTFEDNLSVTRSPRTPRSPKTPSVAESIEQPPSEPKESSPAAGEPQEAEPQVEEAPADETPVEQSDEAQVDAPAESEVAQEVGEEPSAEEKPEDGEAPHSPVRKSSTSPPPRHRAQSPSPPPRRTPRDTSGGDYASVDQDSHRETVPTRLPTTTSFSSWNPPERETYKPISPWVNSSGSKYSEYTPSTNYHPSSHYTSIFDDQVNAGPFSQSLYATNRLLERSRSRSRTRQKALRHSSFQRYASQLPSPLRTNEYAQRSSSLSRGLSRPYTSFTSFLDYSGSKTYELSRYGSRGSLYDSTQALSRTNSRGNIDYYLGAGRISRVDSFVNNLNSRYEWQVPATYELYRASSRDQLNYAPLNQYNTRLGELQRSLSRERFIHDSLKNKYSKVSYQLEQACKQMDLMRTNSYSSLRTGSQPRTSVYSHFYPYF